MATDGERRGDAHFIPELIDGLTELCQERCAWAMHAARTRPPDDEAESRIAELGGRLREVGRGACRTVADQGTVARLSGELEAYLSGWDRDRHVQEVRAEHAERRGTGKDPADWAAKREHVRMRSLRAQWEGIEATLLPEVSRARSERNRHQDDLFLRKSRVGFDEKGDAALVTLSGLHWRTEWAYRDAVEECCPKRDREALVALAARESWRLNALPLGIGKAALRRLDKEGDVELRPWICDHGDPSSPVAVRAGNARWWSPCKEPDIMGQWDRLWKEHRGTDPRFPPAELRLTDAGRAKLDEWPAEDPMSAVPSTPTVSASSDLLDRLQRAAAAVDPHAIDRAAERAAAKAVEAMETRDDTGIGGTDTDWKDVQGRLLAMWDRSEPYTSLRTLAAELGCSDRTIRKAIDDSETLKGWKARSTEPKAAPKATDLGAVVRDNTRQTTEPAPDDVLPDDDVDATMARLIDQAMPDERAKLNALDDAGRRALVAAVQAHNLDDEPSPLESDKPGERPRKVKQHKRA